VTGSIDARKAFQGHHPRVGQAQTLAKTCDIRRGLRPGQYELGIPPWGQACFHGSYIGL